MLGKNKVAAHTLIDANARVVGDVHFTGGLHVQGRIEGNLLAGEAGGDLVIGEGGVVMGEIHAPRVTISGEVHGDIHASEKVKLESKAVVAGNVHYRLVEIVVGARIDGMLRFRGADAVSGTLP
jgi:cytoskeletal protein CcmA (bactofilin family)